MANTVKHARLENPTARRRLKRGRQAHWQALAPRAHLGYRRWPEEPAGQWLFRRYLGDFKYQSTTIGRADDATQADGERVLSFAQAEAKARAMLESPRGTVVRMTVRQAMARYVEYKRGLGQPVGDLLSRTAAHILATLGDSVVAELTAERLRRWLATLAASPAQVRPKNGKPQYKAEPNGDEDIRRRRASANRVLTMLKAGLNHAFDEGHVSNRDAWGRKLKPFRDVEVARLRYLSIAEAQRLINACAADFRPLVIAGLQTGARYGEVANLEVHDFNPAAGTVTIRKTKTRKPLHVVLTAEGVEFFRQQCIGRGGGELMFQHDDGRRWKTSEQGRPMKEACARAKLKPVITYHGLRHTWASNAVMNGVPLMVVAKNLGHRDTRMVERHYGHLAPSFIADAIREGAPRFGLESESNVQALRK
jgi:integrase